MYKRSQPSTKNPFTHQYKENNGRGKFSVNDELPNYNSQLDLGLQSYINDKKFIQLLRKKGIKNLFKIQAACFNFVYQGKDIIARDRTGSGKTLAFTLPVLERFRQKKFQHKYPKMLVILPTRELAIQVNNQIQSLSFENDFENMVVYGKSNIQDNINRLKRGTDILVGTPGRLNDLIQRDAIKLDDLEVLVLDQADEMLKQGFQQQVQKICQAIKKVNSRKVQTLLFSATVPQWVHQLSDKYQSNAKYINMINDQQIRTSKDIKHYSLQVSRYGPEQVVQILEQMIDKYGGYQKRILIFCEKKVDVDQLSRQLKMQNAPLHGDVAQFKRQKAYNAFKNGSLRCIVATNVAARGLDFPSVDLVVQMCPPISTQDYIHRAGRTGRAGKKGTCLTFFQRTKSRLIFKIQNQARIKIQQIRFQGLKNNSNQNRQRRSGYQSQRNQDRSNNYSRDKRERDYSDNKRNYNRQQRTQSHSYGDNRDNRNDNRNNRNQNSNRDPRNRDNYNQNRNNNGYERKNNNSSNYDQRRQNSQNKYSSKQTPSDFKRSPTRNSNARKNSSSRSISRSLSPVRKQDERSQRNNSYNHQSTTVSKTQSHDDDY